jgi:hypothetical protein
VATTTVERAVADCLCNDWTGDPHPGQGQSADGLWWCARAARGPATALTEDVPNLFIEQL